jgi:hypothetical protein
MTKIVTFVIYLHDFFDKLFECKLSKLITKDDYPVKKLTEFKEGDTLVVWGFTRSTVQPVFQKISDYQKYLVTKKVDESTFFLPTWEFVGIPTIVPGKKYQIKKKHGFPSLVESKVFLTRE